VSPALFKDRNFLTGNVFIFVVGAVLYATLALLPPLLQDLLNYPVVTTGLVTAPRGLGTPGGDVHRRTHDGQGRHPLDIIGSGFALSAFASWQMTGFDLQMDSAMVVWSGFSQGLGTGFVYVPLAAATFATLTPALRNEGTAIFSLTRNLGSSIGISVVNVLLTAGNHANHARDARRACDPLQPGSARAQTAGRTAEPAHAWRD